MFIQGRWYFLQEGRKEPNKVRMKENTFLYWARLRPCTQSQASLTEKFAKERGDCGQFKGHANFSISLKTRSSFLKSHRPLVNKVLRSIIRHLNSGDWVC